MDTTAACKPATELILKPVSHTQGQESEEAGEGEQVGTSEVPLWLVLVVANQGRPLVCEMD